MTPIYRPQTPEVTGNSNDTANSQTRKQELPARHRLMAQTTSMYWTTIVAVSIGAGATKAPVVLDNHCSDDAQLRVFSEIEHSLPHTDPVRAMLVQPYFCLALRWQKKGCRDDTQRQPN